MPLDEVDDLFEKLLSEMDGYLSLKISIGSNGINFIKYVSDTYFETTIFPKEFWNHFHTNSSLTNKNVEGNNGKMNLYCGAASNVLWD